MSAAEDRQTTDALRAFFADHYRDDLAELAQGYPQDRRSLYVEYATLWRHDPDLAEDWLAHPERIQAAADAALQQVDLPVAVDLADATARLTDTGAMLDTRSIASLGHDDIGSYVPVYGQIAKVTGVAHRLDTAVYECQQCGTQTPVPQPRHIVDEPHECTGCERDGPYNLDTEASSWVDLRKVKLEQPPDEQVTSASGGQTLPVYVEADLIDVGGPNGLPDRGGDRATVLGTYHVDRSGLAGRNASPEADGWLEARAFAFEADAYDDIDVEPHEAALGDLADHAGDGLIEMYRDSIAPELHASDELETVLEAAVAWLFNAYRVDPQGQGSYRGDLHMGIIGDPGLGKSTILSSLADLAPTCEFRSGTGLSAVGLTAAAVQEEFAGSTEWTLEPGVLPRANGGHCIIDEIDDVVDDQTKKMHDALEGEQTVKIDKAGISANLPTRTALLVSGNPTDGRFDRHEAITDQVDIDPALIDRLDVLFALEDVPNPDADATTASHIIDAYDELSRLETADGDAETEHTDRPIAPDVFRAAIVHARQSVFPTLTPEAKAILRDYYVEVRDLNDADGPIPATPRTLEAGIRLATAFARAEFCDDVLERHAERAIHISRQVVGLNFDPESGAFDAARTSKGEPMSQRTRRRELLALVDSLVDDDPVAHDALVDAGTDRVGAEEATIENDIDHFKQSGELYEPTARHYRRVSD